MEKRIAVIAAAAFAVGVLVGHFAGNSIFGYRTFQECFAKETKGAASVFAARQYCDSLFPGQSER